MAEPRRRTTRSQSATPAHMPVVQSKQSHAYGAQGKTTLQTQLNDGESAIENVMNETSAITTATPSRPTRNSTGNRQTPDRSMRPPQVPRSIRQRAPPPTIEEEAESKTSQAALNVPNTTVADKVTSQLTAAELADRDRTLLSEQRLYAEELARQRTLEKQNRQREEDAHKNHVTHNPEAATQARTATWKVFVSALPHHSPFLLRNANLGQLVNTLVALGGFLLFVFTATVGVCMIYGMANLLPWPAAVEPYAGNVVNAGRALAGLSLYGKEPTELEERWIRFQHDILFEPMLPKDVLPDKQYQVNLLLEFRMDRLEKRVAATERTLGLHNETLRVLNNVLPSHVVVDQINGEYVLGEHFWHAFLQKMGSDAGDPLWNVFLEHNEKAMANFTHEAVMNELDVQHRRQAIISGEDLVAELNKHYIRLKDEHASDLDLAEKSVMKEARAAARAMIDDSPLAHITRLQTTALATHLTVENGLRELHSVNFLSRSLGAVVDRQLSSPTARRPWKGFLHKTYVWWQGIQPFPHGPDMALASWSDAGDAWCAPHSKVFGAAQLAVRLEHVVVPHTFTVEHMPRTGTINIAAAPRDIDVWAEVDNPAVAAQMEAVVKTHRLADCGPAPGPAFVCIGAGTYDIHATNWVQDFPLHARTPEFNIPVKKLVFKALNNWGGDYTCIYRVRMTGDRIV
nr:spindle pole body-associated protein sad1 [Quercus suber]